jgi:hypothetical protein
MGSTSTNALSEWYVDDVTLSVVAPVIEAENRAPVVSPMGDTFGVEGAEITVAVAATDADLPVQALTFFLGAGAPAGSQIDATTGIFRWTPGEEQGPSTNSIMVIVQDDGSPPLSASNAFLVVVSEANTTPVLAPLGPFEIQEGSEAQFAATATDADLPVQALTFFLGADAPAGSQIDATTGIFRWTPPLGWSPATNQITIQATDNGQPPLSATQIVVMVVSSSQRVPPQFNRISLSPEGLVTLIWRSEPGCLYQLQRCQDLRNPVWISIGTSVKADSELMRFTENKGDFTQGYYRIMRIDNP